MADDSTSIRHDIEQLADKFMTSYRAGRCPSLDEFAAQYPALGAELRDLLTALLLLEQNVPHRDKGGSPSSDAGSAMVMPREIGEFTIVREIGRGGMGMVYEAVQQSLGRHVALKVLSTPTLLNPTHLERFRLEARSAARLHHSHIVPVFGVGEHHGLQYYAMQLIQGQSLDLVIEELRHLQRQHQGVAAAPPADPFAGSIADGLLTGRFCSGPEGDTPDGDTPDGEMPWDDNRQHRPTTDVPHATPVTLGESSTRGVDTPNHLEYTPSQSGRQFYRSVARVGLQVAEALAYAHSQGILHRDIKPSNLLLDAKGNVWVTDFGLARDESSDGLTQTGDFVGTLRYMAPERLEGWSDRRSDLYSLGVTLYELLTLKPFLETTARGALVDKIRHEDPPLPSTIDRLIPRDLETIILKSIDKEPVTRYRTADEMAEDLRRFLAGHSILARRATPVERLMLWCRRSPLVAGLSAVIAMLLVGTVVALSASNSQIRQEAAQKEVALSEKIAAIGERDTALQRKDEALRQKERAAEEKDAALELARRNEALAGGRFYAAQMNLASHAWRDGQHARTLQLLETLRPDDSERDLRGFEWYHLYDQSHANVVHHWRAHNRPVLDIVWSPDGTWFASATSGHVCFWDGRTGEPRGVIPTFEQWFWDLDVSADGRLLVGGCGNGEVFVWDTVAKRELRRWMAHPVDDGIRAVAISPDGRRIVTGAGKDNEGSSGQLLLWDLEGRLIAPLEGHLGVVGAVAFSPDGQMLASATFHWDDKKNILLWNVSAEPERVGEIPGIGVSELVFSDDGQTVFGCGGDQRVYGYGLAFVKINVSDVTLHQQASGHVLPVEAITLLKGKDQFVTVSEDRTLRLRAAASGESKVIGAELAWIMSVAADPTGRFVATGDNDGWITLRDLEAPPAITELRENWHAEGANSIKDIAYTPDGQRLIVGYSPLNIVDAKTLKPLALGPQGSTVAMTPQCELVAVDDGHGRIEIWDLSSNTIRTTLKEVGSVHTASFSSDGKFLATAYGYSNRFYYEVWDTQSGQLLDRVPSGQFGVHSIAFAPDAKRLAAGIMFSTVSIYDVATRRTVDTEYASGPLIIVPAVAYSADGTVLAAGFSDGTLVLYDVDNDSGSLNFRSHLSGHSLGVHGLAFNPDHSILASASADRSVRLWDVELAQERITLDVDAKRLRFSPDGRQLALVKGNNTLAILKESDLASARAHRVYRGSTDFDSPDRLVRTAHAAWKDGDLLGAETLLRAAIRSFEVDHDKRATVLDARPLIRCHASLSALLEEQGRVAEAEQIRNRALELADQYLQLFPDSDEAHELQLSLKTERSRSQLNLYASGAQWSEAAASAQQVIEQNPADAHAWYFLALLRLQQRDVVGYRETCAGMVRHFDKRDDLQTRRWLAWTSLLAPDALSEYSVPLESARNLVALPSSAAEYEVSLGGLCYRAGEYADAVRHLGNAIQRLAEAPKEQTTNLYAWLLLAMTEWQLEHRDEARGIWRDVQTDLEAALVSSEAWNRRATLEILRAEAVERLQMDSAAAAAWMDAYAGPSDGLVGRRRRMERWRRIEMFSRSLDANPHDSALRISRARLYAEVEDWDRAAADWAAAIEQSEDTKFWNSPRKRYALELAGDPEIFRRLAERIPQESALWIGRGQHHVLRSQWADAAHAYERAFRTRSLTDETAFEYAGASLLAGQDETYRRICLQLVAQCDLPHERFDSFVTARTCTLRLADGIDPQRLVALADERIVEDKWPWTWHVLGLSHFRAGEFDLAIEKLEKSNAGEWGQLEKSLNGLVLAMSYHHLGEPDKAIKWLNHSLDTIKAARPVNPDEPVRVPVPDWIGLELLSAEATALLGEKVPDVTPGASATESKTQ